MAVAIASSSTVTPGSGTTITITAPSGISTGDLLVAYITTAELDVVDPSTGGPSGWTPGFLNLDAEANAAVLSCTVQMWWKIAVLADESATDYSWTIDSSQYYLGHITRVTGHDQNNPFERIGIDNDQTTDMICPSINPRKDDGLLIAFVGCYREYGVPSTPSGYSSQYAAVAGGGLTGCSIGVFYKTLSSQAATGTATSVVSTAVRWGASHIIINSDESAKTDGDIKTGVFTSPTDGADTTVTPGAEAKAILFFTTGQTATGSVDHAWMCCGMSAGVSDEVAIATASEDNLSAASDTYMGNSRTSSIYLVDNAGAVELEGDVKSISSTQFVIQWSTYDGSNAYKIYYVAFCGDGVEAALVDASAHVSVESQTYAHGLSSIPTTLFTLGTLQTTQGIADGSIRVFGFANDNLAAGVEAANPTFQGYLAAADKDNTAEVVADIQLGTTFGYYIHLITGTGADGRADLTGLDATNVTLDWVDAASSAWDFSMLCLAGVRSAIHIYTLTASSSGTDTIGLADTGVLPQAVLGIAGDIANDTRTIGAGTSSTNRFAICDVSDTAVATTNTLRACSEARFIEAYDTAPAVKYALDIDSFAFDEVTVDRDVADSSDRTVILIALETVPYTVAGPSGIVPFRRRIEGY